MSSRPLFDLNGDRTDAASQPPLPSGWRWTTVKELAANFDGRRIPIKSDDRDKRSGPYAYYGASGVIDDIDDFIFDGDYLLIAEDGANLLSRSTPIAFRASGRFWVNNHAHVIQLRGGIPLGYLQWYLNGTNLQFFITGTAQPKLNQLNLNRIPVPLAPISEQHRIVAKIEELLSDLDAGVAALKRAMANLKRYRDAVLKAAVQGKLTEEWRTKHPCTEPASKLLTRILTERRQKWESDQLAKFSAAGKEPPKGWRDKYDEPQLPDLTDVPKIPAGWAIASMDQLTSTITSGSRDWSQYYGEGTGTFIMAQNVRPGLFELNFRQKVNPPRDDRDRARSQVLQDDLLVTIVGANTGDVCRVDGVYPEHYVCQSVALMRPVIPGMSHFIEAYLVSHENGQRQFRRFIYGQGRPHLGFDQLRVTPVLLPSIAEQAAIFSAVSEKLSQIDAAEVAIDQSLSRAARLRQSILKQAFEGKLVPQDPHDEPASVLLGRLRGNLLGHEENARSVIPSARGRRRKNQLVESTET